jgi:hypothetical protein
MLIIVFLSAKVGSKCEISLQIPANDLTSENGKKISLMSIDVGLTNKFFNAIFTMLIVQILED